MSAINDGGPAFPHVKLDDGTRFIDGVLHIKQTGDTGMSLRAWLAGQALAGETANSAEGAWSNSQFDKLADRCVLAADALIKRLEQP